MRFAWRKYRSAALAIFLGCVGFLVVIWVSFLQSPVVVRENGIRYTVQEGASLRSVIHELYLLDIIKHPYFFYLLVKLSHPSNELKAGEYSFPKGTTPTKLLNQIMTGSGMVYHPFTIVSGWTFRHLRTELSKNPDLAHVSAKMSDAEIMREIGSAGLNPEGWFFPDTYFFVRGTADIVILRQAFLRMQKKLNEAWERRQANLPFEKPIEALTVASLIEKETGLEYERPIIAGVIINRLKKNMLLQIDPTVIYAAGKQFGGTIRRADLLRKSPYNTYVTKGLPPTPIGIPSMASIEATLHPIHHAYYYFVAKNYNMEGPHRFSTTLDEHYQAIARAKQRKSHMEFFNNALIWHYIQREVLPRIYH